MRKQIPLVLACSLSSALFAQTQIPAPAPAASAEEKLSCRYYRQTGSIMPGKRICHTKAEWADIDAQTRRITEHNLGRDQAGGRGAPTGGSGQ
jgi:hypothetical protein